MLASKRSSKELEYVEIIQSPLNKFRHEDLEEVASSAYQQTVLTRIQECRRIPQSTVSENPLYEDLLVVRAFDELFEIHIGHCSL